jgi:hypothetical protein
MESWILGLKMREVDFWPVRPFPWWGVRVAMGWVGCVVDRYGIGAVREPVGRGPSPVLGGKAQVSPFPLVGSFPVDAPTCSGPFVSTNRAAVGRRPERLHEHGIVLPRLDLERFAG